MHPIPLLPECVISCLQICFFLIPCLLCWCCCKEQIVMLEYRWALASVYITQSTSEGLGNGQAKSDSLTPMLFHRHCNTPVSSVSKMFCWKAGLEGKFQCFLLTGPMHTNKESYVLDWSWVCLFVSLFSASIALLMMLFPVQPLFPWLAVQQGALEAMMSWSHIR